MQRNIQLFNLWTVEALITNSIFSSYFKFYCYSFELQTAIISFCLSDKRIFTSVWYFERSKRKNDSDNCIWSCWLRLFLLPRGSVFYAKLEVLNYEIKSVLNTDFIRPLSISLWNNGRKDHNTFICVINQF